MWVQNSTEQDDPEDRSVERSSRKSNVSRTVGVCGQTDGIRCSKVFRLDTNISRYRIVPVPTAKIGIFIRFPKRNRPRVDF